MPSNITFATDQSTVQPQFNQTLVSVALVLKKFDKSIVDVYGHTDSSGSDSYNQTLSERRAESVGNLASQIAALPAVREVEVEHRARVLGQLRPVPAVQGAGTQVVHPGNPTTYLLYLLVRSNRIGHGG